MKKSIDNQKFITITGKTRNNLNVYVSFRKIQNIELARFLNRNYNAKYKLNDNYICYDSQVKELDGNSYLLPKNKKQRKNWLDAMGWEDLGSRFSIARLDGWNIENIKTFIKKTGLKNITIK